ncbi:zinc finger BED domain-containing protein RICESLEEPER 2-like protein, partial [Tanacetum coccineum]
FNAAYKRAKRIYCDEHKGVAFSQEDAWAVLRFHPKWDAPEQVDLTGDVPGATQEDLFGHDARPRPAGKPRPAKKTKSDATASTGGSSASTQFGELMEQELRLKREAAERAFEAQAEKDRTLMRLEELRFLATSTKDLDDDDAYWIKKQKQLIKNKMRNDLGDEDDEDEDEDEDTSGSPSGTWAVDAQGVEAQQNHNSEAGQTSMARDGSVFRYDPDYLCEQLAGLVIQRALPFNHFDHEQTTRVFQNTMQPRYTHVSRSTLKRDAMKLWLAAKQEIIDSFGNINACVNITTDVWSAPHGVLGSYMCVTAHLIEPGTWQMMKRVISFEEFPSPHTGGALFKMLTKVLTNFNLEDKVMSITLDNASNNTSAMDKLKLKYEPPMWGRFYYSRCVAHIINLVMQAGLEVPAIDAIRESFKTMLKDIFKSSARTRQRYVKICKDAEKPCLRPNWDVPTRWNSTYHMFLSGLKQQTTLGYFHDILANKNRCNRFPAENWVIIQFFNPIT